jgi:heparinase II/III-like protein
VTAGRRVRALRHPVQELPGRLVRYVRWRTSDARQRREFARGHLQVRGPRLAAAVAPLSAQGAIEAVRTRRLGATALDARERGRFAAAFRERFPDAAARIVAAAEEACHHRFDLLGSGPTDLGEPIDWCVDFKTGFRWPAGYARDLQPVDLTNDADVKVPWELSRCQHFVTLGQAYWLTSDERYAREFAAQMRQWTDANPVMGTINWYHAMEASIRIVNWLWAGFLFEGSPSWSAGDREGWLASALEHGRFIAANLEKEPYQPSSNHYLADLAGLVYLGVLLAPVPEAARWREAALPELLRELQAQVHEDGVHQECSTGYHRLVTEMAASCFALCRQNGIAIEDEHWRRLERMCEFVCSYVRPDGGAPVVGDADDGRLHALAPAPAFDHRPLLAFAGWLLERKDFAGAGAAQASEAAWWSGQCAPEAPPTEAPRSRAFVASGFYVLRDRDAYLLAVCCDPRGPTGHAHNDTLGFELAASGRPWIVDSGSFVYTASAHWRHAFRSTAAHNVVRVDGGELNPIEIAQLSRRGRQAVPRLVAWRSDETRDRLEVEHGGYAGVGVLHRRIFVFDKRGPFWLIEDALIGEGVHDVEAYLHFDAGLSLEARGPFAFTAAAESASGLQIGVHGLPAGAEIAAGEGWISREYGRKLRAPTLTLRLRHALPLRWTWQLVPSGAGDPAALPCAVPPE